MFFAVILQEQKFLLGVILMVPCYAIESVSILLLSKGILGMLVQSTHDFRVAKRRNYIYFISTLDVRT